MLSRTSLFSVTSKPSPRFVSNRTFSLKKEEKSAKKETGGTATVEAFKLQQIIIDKLTAWNKPSIRIPPEDLEKLKPTLLPKEQEEPLLFPPFTSISPILSKPDEYFSEENPIFLSLKSSSVDEEGKFNFVRLQEGVRANLTSQIKKIDSQVSLPNPEKDFSDLPRLREILLEKGGVKPEKLEIPKDIDGRIDLIRLAEILPSLHPTQLPDVARTIQDIEKPRDPLIPSPLTYWKGTYDLTVKEKSSLKEYVNNQNTLLDELHGKYPQELRSSVIKQSRILKEAISGQEEPIRVAVTGAAGQIGYALLFRIASGAIFGPQTPVSLHLLEIPQVLPKVSGVVMELRDCAFPTLKEIVVTDDAEKAFSGVDYALLVGATPRGPGMERKDLLLKNAEIFSAQGKALNKTAKGKDTRVIVVGNPANTNALIAQRNAPKIPPVNFIAMTRLDHNRGLAQLAKKTKTNVEDISNFIIWGNHSATQVPDITHTLIKGASAASVINDPSWVQNFFIPSVQKRGAEIIAARGASSAASAGSALIDQAVDWHYGNESSWTSAAVYSNGEYGVEKGLFYSYPVQFNHHKQWKIVPDLSIDADIAKRMEITQKELQEERDGVSKLLPN